MRASIPGPRTPVLPGGNAKPKHPGTHFRAMDNVYGILASYFMISTAAKVPSRTRHTLEPICEYKFHMDVDGFTFHNVLYAFHILLEAVCQRRGSISSSGKDPNHRAPICAFEIRVVDQLVHSRWNQRHKLDTIPSCRYQ